MLASWLLVSAYAIVIAAPGDGDEGCPSPRQVSAALQARVPWVMLPPGQTAAPGLLRVAVGPAPGGPRLQLTDATTGEAVLMRLLPPTARGKTGDCPALAETVALIVERYLHDVGYEAPPSPPGPPPPAVVARAPEPSPAPPPPAAATWAWRLGVGVEGRYGDTRTMEGSALLSLGLERPVGGRRWGVRAAGGLGPISSASWSDDRATLRRIPLWLGAYLGLRAGPGWIEPGLDAGVDLLRVSVTGSQNGNSGMHVAPSAGAGVGYTLSPTARFYVRALARGAVAVPYVFLATPATSTGNPVFSTPRTYLEVGLESGVAFP